MRGHSLVLSTILVLAVVAAPPARAVGVIVTTGATIETGAAMHQGVVTVDPAAPVGVVPTLPPIAPPAGPPSLTGSMPSPPSFGNGNEGAFSADGGGPVPVLAPGTHQFTSFTVTNGATVPITGATIILVTGDVSIAGVVSSTATGASITFRCGGNFTLVSGSPASLVQTNAPTTFIEVIAGGKVAIGTDVSSLDARIESLQSNVTIEAHGTTAGNRGVSIKSGKILTAFYDVTIRTVGEFAMGGIFNTRPGSIECASLTIQSFDDRVAWNTNGGIVANLGPAVIEAAHEIVAAGGIDVGGTGPLDVRTVTGPLSVGNNMRVTCGHMTVRSGGDIDANGLTIGAISDANVDIAALGDIHVRDACKVSTATRGEVKIAAAGNIVFDGGAGMDSFDKLTVTSSGGDFIMRDAARMESGGPAVVRVAGDVFIGDVTTEGKAPPTKSPSLGSDVVVNVSYLDLSAGGTVTIDAATARANALMGDFAVLAQGDISVARTVESRRDMALRSIAGDIDVAGAVVQSEDDAWAGAVAVETWKAGGRIDATNGTIRSGFTDDTSGNVDVLVHDPGGPPPVVVESFILPKKLLVQLDAAKPAKNKLTAAGFFDTGPAAIDLTQPATIRVGSKQFDVPGFVADKKGKKFTHTEAALKALIVPNPNGSSRAKFRVLASGAALTGAVPLDGDATLSFEFGAIDGIGTVRLTAGQYRLGRKRGALVAPGLFPVRARAKVAGQGKDALSLIVGLATNGVTPASAPSVHVEFGTGFSLDAESGDFVRKGDRYVAPGVVLDFKRETIAVSAKKTFLGPAFVDGAQPVSVKVRLGNDSREVRVRMVRKGTALFY